MIKLLTADEAIAILRITKHQFYKMAKAGMLPVTYVGRCVRIDEDRLKQWLSDGGSGPENVGLPRKL